MRNDFISRRDLINALFVQNGKMCPDTDIDNFPITINVKDVKKAIRNAPSAKIGGWIPCSERLPEEHDSIFVKLKGTDKWNNAMFEKTSDEANATIEFEDGKRKVKTLHTIDGRWNEGNRGIKFKVIAWQPLPETYHG